MRIFLSFVRLGSLTSAAPFVLCASFAFSLLVSGCSPATEIIEAIADACTRTIVVTTFDERRGPSCPEGDCSLDEAINLANFCNNVSTIQLAAGTYTFTSSVDVDRTLPADSGRTALPAIRADITIEGAGAVIERSADASAFRFFWVADGESLTLNNLTLRGGRANDGDPRRTPLADRGGAIYNDGTLAINNSVLSGNSAGVEGGAIYNAGSMAIADSLISENSTTRDGGGLANAGVADIQRSDITDNASGASGKGGAAINLAGGELTLGEVTVSGNNARFGGGVYNSESLTILKSLFEGNSAESIGGAISSVVSGSSRVTIHSSTFSGNSAPFVGLTGDPSGVGGAIFVSSGSVEILDSTIYNNTASLSGGGLSGDLAGGSYTIHNTIVAGNPGGDCGSADLIATDANVNLDSDETCGFSITADPLLGPLADNGGSTLTHGLGVGSPALDTGSPCLATDQRDMPRPFDGDSDGTAVCDIGAYEMQAGESGFGGGGPAVDTTGTEPETPSQPQNPGQNPEPEPPPPPAIVPNTPPTVAIASPQNGASFDADTFDQATQQWYYELTLAGVGTDAEDGNLSGGNLEWKVDPPSNNVTTLGTGTNVTARLYAPACFGNTYTITLTVTDSDGESVSSQITIVVSLIC